MPAAELRVVSNTPNYAAAQTFRDVCQAAIRVFNLMDKYRTAPYPNAYAVWYAYTTGSNELLISDIDGLLALKDTLSPYDIESLYQEYLACDDGAFVAQNISEAIGSEITSVMEILQQGLRQNDAFTNSLDSVAGQVTGVASEDDLAAVVTSLLEENRRMAEITRQLNEGLSKSQGMISVLNQKLEDVQQQNFRDPVTAIANRRAFDRQLAETVSRSDQLNTSFCLALCEIDDFNALVEIYGHLALDNALSRVAALLSAGLDPEDMVARYGGEVFAFILSGRDLMSAYNRIVKIKHDVKTAVYALKDSEEAISGISVSFGLVRYEPGMSAEQVLEQASGCLLDAKRAGRNVIKSNGLA